LSPTERHFNLASWLDKNTVVHLKSGDEWLLDCPACKRTEKLAVNVRKKAFQCFLCNFAGRKPTSLVAKFTGGTLAEATTAVERATCLARDVVEPLTLTHRKSLHRLLPVASPPPGARWEMDAKGRAYARKRGVSPGHSQAFLLASIGGDGTGSRADRMLAGRLLIPVWDLLGRFVYWIARDVTGNSPVKVLNMPAHEKHQEWGLTSVPACATRNECLVGIHLVTEGTTLYLVEGPLDAVVCGPGFVATMGAKLSMEQAHLIAQSKPSDVVIVFDGDEAGRKGARSAHELLSSFVPTRIANLGDGEDPADVGRERCMLLSPNSGGESYVESLG
jgi:hypothetical protein